jgi:hypothetical protein
VHGNVGNPALNTRPTILNSFLVHFYYFRDSLVKNFISKHLSSKYQVMNEMQSVNVERNFVTYAKQN